jgi:hypothetical protein
VQDPDALQFNASDWSSSRKNLVLVQRRNLAPIEFLINTDARPNKNFGMENNLHHFGIAAVPSRKAWRGPVYFMRRWRTKRTRCSMRTGGNRQKAARYQGQ